MGVIIGTSAGFVTTAPSSDPTGDAYTGEDRSTASLHTSPADAVKIIEIGWYAATASEETNFEVGLYSDAGNNEPETRLQVNTTNAKGTTEGWKSASVDWDIDGSTAYWLAVQIDDTASVTSLDRTFNNGERWANKFSQTSLPSDWGTSTESGGFHVYAIYVVYEEGAAGTNMQINIADVWKPVTAMQINIGDVWKTVAGAQINIGDAWKTIY